MGHRMQMSFTFDCWLSARFVCLLPPTLHNYIYIWIYRWLHSAEYTRCYICFFIVFRVTTSINLTVDLFVEKTIIANTYTCTDCTDCTFAKRKEITYLNNSELNWIVWQNALRWVIHLRGWNRVDMIARGTCIISECDIKGVESRTDG